jgi:hypothetical protein
MSGERSKQRVLMESTITRVERISIDTFPTMRINDLGLKYLRALGMVLIYAWTAFRGDRHSLAQRSNPAMTALPDAPRKNIKQLLTKAAQCHRF